MIRRIDQPPPEIAEIHARCFEHPWSAGVFADLAVKPHHRLYVLEDNGRVVSFIVLAVVVGEGEILTLATDPDVQGRGFARRLLESVIAELRVEGQESLFLEVAIDNAAALALYSACGFERAGLRKAYYSRNSGPPVDGYILRLALI
jgi:[ribosomal protein S18]-alanine N-acetyltransferase